MVKINSSSERYNKYTTAVRQSVTIEIEYRAAREALADLLRDENSFEQNKASIKALVNWLYEKAQYQEGLYRDHLCVPRLARAYRADAQFYARALGRDENSTESIVNQLGYTSNGWAWWWRQTWGNWLNILRLTIVRIRRFLNVLAAYLNNANFLAFMRMVESYVAVVFSYASWVSFIPRLILNTGIIFKHLLFPEPGSAENNYHWMLRLRIQFERRWNELLNDIVWVIGGFVNFCMIAPAMQPPLAVGLQCFDLCNALARSYVELHRVYDVLAEYCQDDILYAPIQKQALRMEVNRERDVWTFSGLVLGAVLMLPAVAVAPHIPVIAMGLVLMLTFVRIYWNNHDEDRRVRQEVDNMITLKLSDSSEDMRYLKT